MNAKVFPSRLSGRVEAVPSKSYAHRMLIAAALADRPTRINRIGRSQDVCATIGGLIALGATIERKGEDVIVHPVSAPPASALVDCNESGSTLRFLIPVAAALGVEATFVGKGRLAERPVAALVDALGQAGVRIEGTGLPLSICGRLTSDGVEVDGGLSSQYVTGMLFALAAQGGNRRLKVKGKRVSESYLALTIDVLARFGVRVTATAEGYTVVGNLRSPGEITVEGDWSNAAFFAVCGALSGTIEIVNLNPHSLQGDRRIVSILEEAGAAVEAGDDFVRVSAGKLKAISADCEQIPDLVPVVAVLTAFAEGRSVLTGVARLKLKESDRLTQTVRLIEGLGGAASATEHRIVVDGQSALQGGQTIEGTNDHRLVMAGAVGAAATALGATITDAEAVHKSYPDFWEVFEATGGRYELDV